MRLVSLGRLKRTLHLQLRQQLKANQGIKSHAHLVVSLILGILAFWMQPYNVFLMSSHKTIMKRAIQTLSTKLSLSGSCHLQTLLMWVPLCHHWPPWIPNLGDRINKMLTSVWCTFFMTSLNHLQHWGNFKLYIRVVSSHPQCAIFVIRHISNQRTSVALS